MTLMRVNSCFVSCDVSSLPKAFLMFDKVLIAERLTHGVPREEMCSHQQQAYIDSVKHWVAQISNTLLQQCVQRSSDIRHALNSRRAVPSAQRGTA